MCPSDVPRPAKPFRLLQPADCAAFVHGTRNRLLRNDVKLSVEALKSSWNEHRRSENAVYKREKGWMIDYKALIFDVNAYLCV